MWCGFAELCGRVCDLVMVVPIMECVLVADACLSCKKTTTNYTFAHPIDNKKIMRAFLPKRRLTANSAEVGTGPCTIPDYYHNLNPTDCLQRRGRDSSMLRRRF